jgi:hypothetical protein
MFKFFVLDLPCATKKDGIAQCTWVMGRKIITLNDWPFMESVDVMLKLSWIKLFS